MWPATGPQHAAASLGIAASDQQVIHPTHIHTHTHADRQRGGGGGMFGLQWILKIISRAQKKESASVCVRAGNEREGEGETEGHTHTVLINLL